MKLINKKLLLVLAVLCLIVGNFAVFLPRAGATGTLTTTNLVEMGNTSEANPMIASDQQAFAIDFTTSSSGAITGTGCSATCPAVKITFPAGFTIATSGFGTPSASAAGTACTSMFTGSAALPGTLTATGAAQVLTITGNASTNLVASTNYCTEVPAASTTNPFTNNATPGQYNVTVGTYNSSATLVDQQVIAIDVLSSGGNAYTITGTINPTFSMSESGTTDSFATPLSASAFTTSNGITWTLATNARSGWNAWVIDSSAGLHSIQASKTINTVATGSSYNFSANTGAENYGLGIYTVTGGAAANANYTDTAHTGTGSGLSTTVYNLIASDSAPASSDTFKTVEIANIAGSTPPATDYSDTITVIGAGSF